MDKLVRATITITEGQQAAIDALCGAVGVEEYGRLPTVSEAIRAALGAFLALPLSEQRRRLVQEVAVASQRPRGPKGQRRGAGSGRKGTM